MEKLFKRYELLSEDVKYQMGFISNVYDMDFNHLNEMLKEMEELQSKIIQKQFEEYKKS
jgi:hypothetical protein